MHEVVKTSKFVNDVNRIFAHHISKFGGIKADVVKDARQAAWVAALSKMQTWDPNKGAKPGTYVYRAIQDAVTTTIIQWKSRGLNKDIRNKSVDEVITYLEENACDHHIEIYAARDCRVRLNKLTPDQIALINRHLVEGVTTTCIGAQGKNNRTTVWRQVQVIINTLMNVR